MTTASNSCGDRRVGIKMAVLVFLVVVLDQLSKQIVLALMAPRAEVRVTPFFSIVLTFNKGIAFGMLRDLADPWRTVLLLAMMAAAFFLLYYMLSHSYAGSLWGQTGMGLVIGGAAGNIIDRVRLGEVVDFLDFFVGSYHWPAFNLADSAVCVGVAILMFCSPREKGK
jgi:signal peptidase II